MKKENSENLNELLAKFMTAGEAAKAAEDIIAGERILDSNPAPRPSAALLGEITERMAAARKHRQVRHRWEFATTAAAAVIIVCAGLFTMREYSEIKLYSQASELFWQETAENRIDEQITQFYQQEADTALMTFETAYGYENTEISDVTDELNEINETFWEG